MKFTQATIAWAAAALASGAWAADESSAESATSVAAELPTFTVSHHPIRHPPCVKIADFVLRSQSRNPAPAKSLAKVPNLTFSCLNSPPPSRLPSLSSSPTTGRPDGSLPTPRRTPATTRSGPTSASGPSRSLPSTREWRATRVLLSRTPPLTTPSRPSSRRPLTPRTSLWLSSTRSSFRVSTDGT